MDFSNKKVLVIGIGISGISACKLLHKVSANITISDSKELDKINFDLKEIKDLGVNIITGKNPDDIILDFDLVVLSPSVPLALPFIQNAIEKGVKVIPEVELAYLLLKGSIIGITGTNGKTTTTNLTYTIFKEHFNSVFETGNIGTPICDYALESNDNSYFITELSSYMLETVSDFHVKTAIILNITEDHILRHKTMENYKNAKMNIMKNQTEKDNVILCLDDSYTKNMKGVSKAKEYFFTITANENADMYLKDGFIYENITSENAKFIAVEDIKILGKHNLYNIMASAIASLLEGIDRALIINVIKKYMGVEHRIEFVKEIKDVTYYNDSKGTNVDAAICAIDAMVRPIVLIAGGDEKNVSLDELVEKITTNVKYCVFVGKTKEKLKDLCVKLGYNNFYVASDYDDAVKNAYDNAQKGDCVLLSPACASFDMFDNFEQRGKYFKELVYKL